MSSQLPVKKKLHNKYPRGFQKVVSTMVVFFVFLSLSLSSSAASESSEKKWKMNSTMVRSQDGSKIKHQLEFTLDQTKYYFVPQKPPFGLIFDKEIHLNGQTYFITGWAHGAATMLFKVFAPGINKATPVCEAISTSEEADLRFHDGKIQLSIRQKGGGSQVQWINCQ